MQTNLWDETDEAPESTQEDGNNSWEEDTSSGDTDSDEKDD